MPVDLCLIGVDADQVLSCCGLQDHGADRRRDDVVQLASNPIPFGAHCLTFDQFLVLLEQTLLLGERAGHPSQRIGRRDQSAHEDHVGPVVMALVDKRVVGQHDQRHVSYRV